MEGRNSFYIQSIDRAVKIIDVVAQSGHNGVKLAAVAESVGLNIATAYRIIKNLLEANYLTTRPDNSYILGSELVRLGELAGSKNNLIVFSHPILEKAAAESGQTAYLAMPDVKEHTIHYVDKVAHKGNIQLSAGIGEHNYSHSTANGKILMSAYPEESIRGIFSRIGMPKMTDKTISSVDKYLKELEKVRELGYAVDLEENEPNVVCVAAPVYSASGGIIASMSLSGIVGITMHGDLGKNIELVKKYAGQLSEKLGYRK